tara:strand:- start:37 stop:411 length:375 start_codon:yes stop_codon:yes gene_type:complete
MKTKYVSLILLFTVFSYNQLNAGCGSCAADKNRTSKAFIEMVPSNGKVDGKTFASCGMCNFDTNDRSCGLSVKIGKEIYKVVNVDIDAHVDSHAKDGFCNVVRIANLKGKVKKNKLYADSFSLQ